VVWAIKGGLRSGKDSAATDPDTIANTTREKIFLLSDDKWSTYRIPSTARSIRVFSQINAVGNLEQLAREEVNYRIKYRIETLAGKVRDQGEFSYTTRAVPARDTVGNLVPGAFYPENDWLPLSGRISQLDGYTGSLVLLKLKAVPTGKPVVAMAARVSCRHPVTKRKLAYHWERLQGKKQEELASASVHGSEGLGVNERLALLANRWAPLAPQGIPGRDFRELFLYTRTDVENAFLPREGIPNADESITSSDLLAVVGIPGAGNYRFAFEPRTKESFDPRITFRSYGESIHQRGVHETILGKEQSISLDLAAGLVEIESFSEFSIRVFHQGIEIEQPPTLVRTWIAGPGNEVSLPCSAGSVIKVVARRIDPDAEFIGISWKGTGTSLEERVALTSEVSRYDRAVDGEEDYHVFERNEYVLSAPTGAETLRISSEKAVAVNFYSRPANLIHRTRVPSDYQRALPSPDRQPIWFGVRPGDFDQRIRDRASTLLRTQTRPPEDNEDILAGRYYWEDFAPGSNARGYYLLEKRDLDSPIREEALPMAFLRIPVNREVDFPLFNPVGLDLPSRRFAYVKPGNQRADLEVLIDGVILHRQTVASASGEILLPPISPNADKIEVISSSPIELFINYVELAASTHLKRFGQRIRQGNQLDFQVEKKTADIELATGRIYLPFDFRGSPLKVKVNLSPVDSSMVRLAANGYTPTNRDYTLESPGESEEVMVLGGVFKRAGLWQKFFVPLGPDLPPGLYDISVQYTEGPEGYFILSKVTGGIYPKGRFAREAIR
jgi:hypothetical protein